MPEPSHALAHEIGRRLNELVSDRVVFTIHDGDPDIHGTANLAFGDGLPQAYSFAEGGSVGFRIPAMPIEHVQVPLPRRWWHIGRRYRTETRTPLVQIEAVMMWSDGRPIMPVNLEYSPIVLVSGSVLIVTPNGKPRTWAA